PPGVLTVAAFAIVSGLKAAAGLLDGRARAPGERQAPDRDRLLELAGEYDPHPFDARPDQSGLAQRLQINRPGLQPGHRVRRQRLEAELGQPALQRHLAALEAHLVVAAGTGVLALVPEAAGLADAGAAAAADAQALGPGARRGFEIVQAHGLTLHRQQIGHLADEATDGRRVLHFHGVSDATQAQAAHTGLVGGQALVGAAHQPDLDSFRLGHDPCHPMISSSFLPRLAAKRAGSLMLRRPFRVARTTLMGFELPMHLASTSCTPATSNTARIGPPAMMPVPSEAGCM